LVKKIEGILGVKDSCEHYGPKVSKDITRKISPHSNMPHLFNFGLSQV
jgi:hypothetical protein